MNTLLVGLVVVIILFLLCPILFNYRKEYKCRRMYNMYGKYCK